ncbi:tail fiber assembly protein [Lelliottia sp. RWM.1]|uniref:tail fiber assembly protein n=1 Tax=Lelliottia sp. RWM.1 TaxID=2663242 RepID=UPI001EF0772E|nr:tail fiber assembly protein [Lelliottia sp. RWM.1]
MRLHADSEISWRQDAVTDRYATESETEELKAWKKYRVFLMRVDLAEVPNIKWPVAPLD